MVDLEKLTILNANFRIKSVLDRGNKLKNVYSSCGITRQNPGFRQDVIKSLIFKEGCGVEYRFSFSK